MPWQVQQHEQDHSCQPLRVWHFLASPASALESLLYKFAQLLVDRFMLLLSIITTFSYLFIVGMGEISQLNFVCKSWWFKLGKAEKNWVQIAATRYRCDGSFQGSYHVGLTTAFGDICPLLRDPLGAQSGWCSSLRYETISQSQTMNAKLHTAHICSYQIYLFISCI